MVPTGSLSFRILLCSLAVWTIGPYDALAGSDGKDVVNTIETGGLDLDMVRLDDLDRDLRGELALYGRTIPVDIDLLTAASYSEEDGMGIWRLIIRSADALATELFFDRFDVGGTGELTLESSDGSVFHSFTSAPIGRVNEFATPLIPGDRCLLTYRRPLNTGSHAEIRIGLVGHAYRFLDILDECQIDVSCSPEGDGWEDAARGVVRISILQSAGTGWCSGSLMNNVRQDCTPYVLSAWHCGSGSTASQFNLFKFYFSYQRPQCAMGNAPGTQYITGGQLRAYSNDNSGNSGSDFMLVEMNDEVPQGFNAYYSGWDATQVSVSTANGVSIHHPFGAPKAISTYTQSLTTGHWAGSTGLLSHWRTYWAATENGHCITRSGSSGSPLFKRDSDGRALVIGTLSGSVALSCETPNGATYYGKLSYHWTGNPNTPVQKLAHWLDPENTGTLILPGSNDPCMAASIEENNAIGLSIHPNPADDRITITWNGSVGHAPIVSIVDVHGRVLSSKVMLGSQMMMFTGDLPNGMHWIRATDPKIHSRAIEISRPLLIRH